MDYEVFIYVRNADRTTLRETLTAVEAAKKYPAFSQFLDENFHKLHLETYLGKTHIERLVR